MELEQSIRAIVVEQFLFGKADGLTSTQSLLGTGILDSTGVLELVSVLERDYEIQIADRDLVPENLDTIDGIVSFVRAKQAARSAA